MFFAVPLGPGVGFRMDDRRKRRRFPVQQPAVLIVKNSVAYEIRAITENVSESGALLLTDSAFAEGTAVQLILTLEEKGLAGLRLSCPGRVVRTESTTMGTRVAVAIECSQALTEYARSTRSGPSEHGKEVARFSLLPCRKTGSC